MLDSLQDFYSRRFSIVLIVVLVALTLLAYANRFIHDDAFISFRYAHHLATGKGLVWNPGEKIEGYTNFLWTLLMSLPVHLGKDPVGFSLALGILSFFLSLLFTYKLASLVFDSRNLGLLTTLLLGTNYTFSAYATGGLETQFQAFLFTAAAYLLLLSISENLWSHARLLLLSLVLAAAMLARPDSAILVAVAIPVAKLYLWRENVPRAQKLKKLSLLSLPFTVIIGAWVLWKLSYYGDLLPNSYYAKVSSRTSLGLGARYLGLFLLSYWLVPFPFLAFLKLRVASKKPNPAILVPFVLLVMWFVYVIRVGGDFMEFRLIVPVMPLVFILVTWVVFRCVPYRVVQAALVALVLAGTISHGLTFDSFPYRRGIESIPMLEGHLTDAHQNWDGIGRVLGAVFEGSDVTIATTASGAIPYYSRLRTIDQFGVSDAWIARNGYVIGARPGHQVIPTLAYLVERGVHLVIGHPTLKRRDAPDSPGDLYDLRDYNYFYMKVMDADRIPPSPRIVEIPIDEAYSLVTFYPRAHPAIERAIQENGWKVHPVLVQHRPRPLLLFPTLPSRSQSPDPAPRRGVEKAPDSQ